jgi:DNA-directed RNA polymerase subunit K/omega
VAEPHRGKPTQQALYDMHKEKLNKIKEIQKQEQE